MIPWMMRTERGAVTFLQYSYANPGYIRLNRNKLMRIPDTHYIFLISTPSTVIRIGVAQQEHDVSCVSGVPTLQSRRRPRRGIAQLLNF